MAKLQFDSSKYNLTCGGIARIAKAGGLCLTSRAVRRAMFIAFTVKKDSRPHRAAYPHISLLTERQLRLKIVSINIASLAGRLGTFEASMKQAPVSSVELNRVLL